MPYSYLLALLLWSCFWGGACLALCAARLGRFPRVLAWAALACGLHALALVLPPWQSLAALVGFEWPASNPLYHPVDWTGKVAALLVSVFFLYGLRRPTPAQAGLRRFRWEALRVGGPVVGVVAALLLLDAYLSRHAFGTLWWPEQVFYSLVPGLEEELFYRGVLPGLLSPVFARTLPLPGTRTSWGGLVGVLLFGLGHGVKFAPFMLLTSAGWPLSVHAWWWRQLLGFPPMAVAYPLAMGLLLLWVRERTGSVWPAVVAHCLFNTVLTVGHALG